MNASLPVNIYFYAQTHMWDQSPLTLPPISFVKEMHSFLVFFLHLLRW